MNDYLIQATAANGQIRIFAATTKNTVETSRLAHHTSPVVTQALGRLLTSGLLMGSMLKNKDELITLKVLGDGPIQGLIVTADSKGGVKGYPHISKLDDSIANPLNVSEAIGSGSLTVIKDMGLKEPYVGYSPLVSSEIAEDLTYYYAKSEQIPTSVSLGVLLNSDGSVKQAGGYLIQLLPNTKEETITSLETALANSSSMTKLLDASQTPEMILASIFADLNLKINAKKNLSFSCNCSRNRVTKALVAIGKTDLEDMISADETIELNCDFCNTKYLFTIDELQYILNRMHEKEAYYSSKES